MVGDTALHRPQGLSASPGHNPDSSVWPAVCLLLLMETATSSFREVPSPLSTPAQASSEGTAGAVPQWDYCPTAAFLDVEIAA